MNGFTENLGISAPECIDSLMAEAQGQDLDAPQNAGLVQRLEPAMVDGANLISTILECSVPGCNREVAVTTIAGRISLDAAFESGQCVAAPLNVNS